MNKIEQFIKKNKGCPLTPAATKQLLTKLMEFLGKELPGMIEEGSGNSLKMGNYIYNEETEKFEWVEDIPENYTGIAYYFGNDVFEIEYYYNGTSLSLVSIGTGSIVTPALYADTIDFTRLTHSFNELDPTLKQIIEDAILAGSSGVACTQAQWSVIKALLDKSLYLNYAGHSLIKSWYNGIDDYYFGCINPTDIGYTLQFIYANDVEELRVIYLEV